MIFSFKQTMSCKLLLNLVDCIRQRSDAESPLARELLITMLRVFTMKFQTIAKIQLPIILSRWYEHSLLHFYLTIY